MYSMPFGHDFWISMRYLFNKLFLEKNHFSNGISCIKSVYRNLFYRTFQHYWWPPCGNLYDVAFCSFYFSMGTIETTQDCL